MPESLKGGLRRRVQKNSIIIAYDGVWWSIRESNPWPPQCHCGALPTALMPHVLTTKIIIAQTVALVKGVYC